MKFDKKKVEKKKTEKKKTEKKKTEKKKTEKKKTEKKKNNFTATAKIQDEGCVSTYDDNPFETDIEKFMQRHPFFETFVRLAFEEERVALMFLPLKKMVHDACRHAVTCGLYGAPPGWRKIF